MSNPFKFQLTVGDEQCLRAEQFDQFLCLGKSIGPKETAYRGLKDSYQKLKQYLQKHNSKSKTENPSIFEDEEVTLPFFFYPTLSFEVNHLINALAVANHEWHRQNAEIEFKDRSAGSLLLGKWNGLHLSLGFVGAVWIWIKRDFQWQLAINSQITSQFTEKSRAVDGRSVMDDIQLTLPTQVLGMSESFFPGTAELQLKPGDRVFIHTDGLLGDEASSLCAQLEASGLYQDKRIECVRNDLESWLKLRNLSHKSTSLMYFEL